MGTATADPAALVQPFTFWVTLYVPPAVTVIEEVVAPLLHNKVPVALVVNTVFPQLLTAVTFGVDGVAFTVIVVVTADPQASV